MDDIQKLVIGGETDASLARFFIGTGIFVPGQRVKESFSGFLETNAMSGGMTGGFVAVPDKYLPVQCREHIHIAIVYISKYISMDYGWKSGYLHCVTR